MQDHPNRSVSPGKAGVHSGIPIRPSADVCGQRRGSGLCSFLILFYIYICLLWHTANIFTPLALAISKSPFRGADSWLCAAGLVLTVWEWIMTRGFLEKGYFLLLGICVCAAVSSIIYIRYGFRDNLFSILWMLITFSLFYHALFHINTRQFHIYLKILYGTFLIIWCAACCLALVQFCLRISRSGPHYATTPWLGGTGFTGRRLVGLFGFPEYGAIPGVMLILAGIYYIVTTPGRIAKAVLTLLTVPIFLYVVLSDSRNAALAMLEVIFAGVLIFSLKRMPSLSPKGVIKAFVLAVVSVILFCCLYAGTQAVSKNVPGLFDKIITWPEEEAQNSSVLILPRTASAIPARTNVKDLRAAFADTGRGSANISPVLTLPASPGIQASSEKKSSSDKQSSSDSSSDKQSQEEKRKSRMFQRKLKDDDITTGRLKIWKDYLSLRKEIGLFGLSPENASLYLQENYPDLHIVAYIRENYPATYATGYVFHTHSGYLRVLVASGFLGMACLLLFMLLCAGESVRCILYARRLSPAFLFSLLIVLTGASSALFDNELFFNQNPTTFLFWICLCAMLRSASSSLRRSGKKADA